MKPKAIRAAMGAVIAAVIFAGGFWVGWTVRKPGPVPPKPPVKQKPKAPALEQVPWSSLAQARDDLSFGGLAQACAKSLDYFRKLPPDRVVEAAGRKVTAGRMAAALQHLVQILQDPKSTPEAKRSVIERNFDLYKSTGRDGKGSVLFTGYYAPVYKGSLKPEGPYRYPIYSRPQDLVSVSLSQFGLGGGAIFGRVKDGRLVPYYTRKEIQTNGILKGQRLELAWLKDPLDAYLLQVQGSGMLELTDGDLVEVLYAGKNGRPYKSLGQYLVHSGEIGRDAVSMQAIRRYLKEHPSKVRQALDHNPSFTFFRIGHGGPYGSLGVTLTPYRSIATDKRIFPQGVLCLIRTRKPRFDSKGKITSWEPFTRFVLNQDTGGAILGRGHVDLYCGMGDAAGRVAGHMKENGELYILLPRPAVDGAVPAGKS
ncbi:MAG: MltA domain-containing protein [Acidobacteriota bacterium]|jgi:membrane-bound lytic murein transglycosylase A